MVKKTLIHFPEDKIAPKGGPAGYLYNLRLGLESIGAVGFDFLPPTGGSYEQNKLLQRIVPERVKDIRRLHNLLCLPNKSLAAPVNYSDYACLHFHSTEDLYLHRNALESYDGKVILTSHSPCAYHRELISRLNPIDVGRKKDELASLEQIDRYAFQRADAVVFPCPEAEEPYFHTWSGYASVRDETKLYYLPTGIRGCVAKKARSEVRSYYGIPETAFVISYAGRHNSVKGYDSLVKAILPILDEDADTWMLVAGKEGPICSPTHARWIEAGWTSDPHSLIAASDVFVLPNHETYFDLIMLEVLSLGQIVLASDTGGNKLFRQYDAKGIILYDGDEELTTAVNSIKRLSTDQRGAARSSNKALYLKEFTCDKFANRYIDCMNGVCGA